MIFYFQDTVRKIDALKSLRPNSKYTLRGDVLEWDNSNEEAKPSDTEIANEVTRLQAEYDALEYQRKRQAEYPPMADYLDAVVKGDDAQKQKYIDDCKAVKEKYPK
jgi:phage terminase large subunit-like protein